MVALALKSLMAATAASLLVAFLPEVPPYDAKAGRTSSQFSSLLRRMLSRDALGRVLRYLMKFFSAQKKNGKKPVAYSFIDLSQTSFCSDSSPSLSALFTCSTQSSSATEGILPAWT